MARRTAQHIAADRTCRHLQWPPHQRGRGGELLVREQRRKHVCIRRSLKQRNVTVHGS